MATSRCLKFKAATVWWAAQAGQEAVRLSGAYVSYTTVSDASWAASILSLEDGLRTGCVRVEGG